MLQHERSRRTILQPALVDNPPLSTSVRRRRATARAVPAREQLECGCQPAVEYSQPPASKLPGTFLKPPQASNLPRPEPRAPRAPSQEPGPLPVAQGVPVLSALGQVEPQQPPAIKPPASAARAERLARANGRRATIEPPSPVAAEPGGGQEGSVIDQVTISVTRGLARPAR